MYLGHVIQRLFFFHLVEDLNVSFYETCFFFIPDLYI